MIGAIAGMLAKQAAKEVAKKGSRAAAREAAKKAAKKEDLLTKGAIGAGAGTAAVLGNEYGKSRAKDREAMESYPEEKAMESYPEESDDRPTRGGMKKGGAVKSSASKRADGCAVRGKTKGRMV